MSLAPANPRCPRCQAPLATGAPTRPTGSTLEQGTGDAQASMYFGSPLLGVRRPPSLGGSPRWTKAPVESNHGASLEDHAGRRPVVLAEQAVPAAVADGDLDYHIAQRARFFGHRAGAATGLLVTEEPGSLWAGTVLSRRAFGKQAAQALLGGTLFLALLGCGGEPGVRPSAQEMYTLAEAVNARAVLQTLGRSITIGGDGPYTIQLWPHAGAANYQLTQLLHCGQGATRWQGTPDLNSFAGMLSNAQGTTLPMLLDLTLPRATQANHTLAARLVEQSDTKPATTARSVAGRVVQVSEVQLLVPPAAPSYAPYVSASPALTQERKPALPYHDHDYVFWLCIPDQREGDSHA